MKKLLVLLGLIGLFVTIPVNVNAAPPHTSHAVHRVSAWNLVGHYVINFDCSTCVPHNITISSYNPYTGVFSGYGTYSTNPAYTWTVSGLVSGNQISMRILYTGQGAGYYVDLTGVIAANGSMSGSATDSSGGHFGWTTTSGYVMACRNHGQFVRDQDDKQMAARSEFGMPVRR